MKQLLARQNIQILAQFAASPLIVAFDFDGTLAPIVADREKARMRQRTRQLLKQVCQLYPCAIISGRSRHDVLTRVKGTGLRQVVGNHGLVAGDTAMFARQISAIVPVLQRALGKHVGIEIENQRFSLAIHYRRSHSKRAARRAIQAALAQLPQTMRVVPGKLVVNVIPRGASDKGQALLRLRKMARVDRALYVGDDVTDEDVFTLKEQSRLLAVRVGKTKSSAAAYFIRDQREMDRLLTALIALRQRA